MESHLLFSTQQETSHFLNKTERLFLEVCKVLIIWILIIVCGLSFGWRFLIIFRISSVEKSIVGTDSSVFFFFFFCFLFLGFFCCYCCCESRRKFTVISYNGTLVSKRITENIGLFFDLSNKFVPV